MAFLHCYWPRGFPFRCAVLPDGKRSYGGIVMAPDRFSFSLSVTWERSILDGLVTASWQISSSPQRGMRYVRLKFALFPFITRNSPTSAALSVRLSDD